MKIEKIDDNKIKVTLSLNDLEKRNIDVSSLNYNSPATQELLWDMMEEAEIQLGFQASDSQLCVEAVPDSIEGFVITITKLEEEGNFESIHKYIKDKYKNTDTNVKKRPLESGSNKIIYFFDDFDDFCVLAKKMYNFYAGASTLFKYKKTYYLMLNKSKLLVSNMHVFESLLSEYGNRVEHPQFYEGFLNEYGDKIIDFDAIETINNYF